MPRIVVLVLALFVLWRVVSALGRRSASRGLGADSYSRFHPRQRRRRSAEGGGLGASDQEELVECTQCGAYVPRMTATVGGAGGETRCASCRGESRGGGRDEA
ncbi:MAG: hypothetical protein MUC56_07030 [Thermoanaerobaculales bacterium]|nr:hypothetical protein [Thermoanaerobaculales bacterium]